MTGGLPFLLQAAPPPAYPSVQPAPGGGFPMYVDVSPTSDLCTTPGRLRISFYLWIVCFGGGGLSHHPLRAVAAIPPWLFYLSFDLLLPHCPVDFPFFARPHGQTPAMQGNYPPPQPLQFTPGQSAPN